MSIVPYGGWGHGPEAQSPFPPPVSGMSLQNGFNYHNPGFNNPDAYMQATQALGHQRMMTLEQRIHREIGIPSHLKEEITRELKEATQTFVSLITHLRNENSRASADRNNAIVESATYQRQNGEYVREISALKHEVHTMREEAEKARLAEQDTKNQFSAFVQKAHEAVEASTSEAQNSLREEIRAAKTELGISSRRAPGPRQVAGPSQKRDSTNRPGTNHGRRNVTSNTQSTTIAGLGIFYPTSKGGSSEPNWRSHTPQPPSNHLPPQTPNTRPGPPAGHPNGSAPSSYLTTPQKTPQNWALPQGPRHQASRNGNFSNGATPDSLPSLAAIGPQMSEPCIEEFTERIDKLDMMIYKWCETYCKDGIGHAVEMLDLQQDTTLWNFILSLTYEDKHHAKAHTQALLSNPETRTRFVWRCVVHYIYKTMFTLEGWMGFNDETDGIFDQLMTQLQQSNINNARKSILDRQINILKRIFESPRYEDFFSGLNNHHFTQVRDLVSPFLDEWARNDQSARDLKVIVRHAIETSRGIVTSGISWMFTFCHPAAKFQERSHVAFNERDKPGSELQSRQRRISLCVTPAVAVRDDRGPNLRTADVRKMGVIVMK